MSDHRSVGLGTGDAHPARRYSPSPAIEAEGARRPFDRPHPIRTVLRIVGVVTAFIAAGGDARGQWAPDPGWGYYGGLTGAPESARARGYGQAYFPARTEGYYGAALSGPGWLDTRRWALMPGGAGRVVTYRNVVPRGGPVAPPHVLTAPSARGRGPRVFRGPRG